MNIQLTDADLIGMMNLTTDPIILVKQGTETAKRLLEYSSQIGKDVVSQPAATANIP